MKLINCVMDNKYPRESVDSILKEIIPEDNFIYKKSGMSAIDHYFLSGIIKKYKPKNILELGVASGYTTCVIASTLKQLNLKGNIVSIDISDKFLDNNENVTGYLFDLAREKIGWGGGYKKICSPSTVLELDKLDYKFDLCVIDTAHFLPGELLDFLCILPFLNEKSLVVLHDINWDQFYYFATSSEKKEMIKASNGILFSTVVSEKKYINHFSKNYFSNIGAFEVNEITREHIINVFLALTILWYELPPISLLTTYKFIIKKYYTENLFNIFSIACVKNINHFFNKDKIIELLKKENNYLEKLPKNLYIYGMGTIGKTFADILIENKLQKCINGFIHSENFCDDQREYKDISNYSIDKIKLKKGDTVIICLTYAQDQIKSILKNRFEQINIIDIYELFV